MANKKPITVLEILQKIRMHVSVPQCDVFGYFSIESEIVILIIPVDHYPKALQVGFSTCCASILLLSSMEDLGGGEGRRKESMAVSEGRSCTRLAVANRTQRSGRGQRLRCCDSERAEMEGICSSSRRGGG